MTGRIIEKKCLPEFFREVRARRKTFELRKDEDGVEVGDILLLREWDGERFTGYQTRREVTFVLRDCPQLGLAPGHCIIAIQPPGWPSPESEAAEELIMEAVCDVCHWPYQYRNEDAEVLYAEKCAICPAASRVRDVLSEAAL